MLFALFSLSPIEIIILGGMCFAPVIVGVVLLVVLRSAGSGSRRPTALEEEHERLRMEALEEENQRLREELDRRKKDESSEGFTP